jgi:hypothetical protein
MAVRPCCHVSSAGAEHLQLLLCAAARDCPVGSAGAGLISSCCAPQVLQFGLYEFIREEGNPGGVRKMKKGTEVWKKIVFS